MPEGLVEEERGILAEKRKLEDCDCKEGMFPTSGRRALLRSAVALAGAAPVAFLARGAGADAPPGAVEYDVPDNPTKVQGRLTGDDGGYGTRSQFETEVRWRFPTPTKESSWTMTPLEHGHGIITPSGLHFERHHGGIPTIDPTRHTLIVHGMVDRPKKYTISDLERFAASRCPGRADPPYLPHAFSLSLVVGRAGCGPPEPLPGRDGLRAAHPRAAGRRARPRWR